MTAKSVNSLDQRFTFGHHSILEVQLVCKKIRELDRVVGKNEAGRVQNARSDSESTFRRWPVDLREPESCILVVRTLPGGAALTDVEVIDAREKMKE
jgi:hypothetical protein